MNATAFETRIETAEKTQSAKPQTILTDSANPKIAKGRKLGWFTYGIHFSPAWGSGFNVCSHASKTCALVCLNFSGHGQFNSTQQSRIRKTQRFFADKNGFLTQLAREIRNAIKRARKNGFEPCFRLNLTSDLPWEKIRFPDGKTIMGHFPGVQFYDYTKNPGRMAAFLAGEFPRNYSLTFSRSEENEPLALSILKSGGNVAVVFRDALPSQWHGVKVIDGDETDLRFLDPVGVVVGLTAKGKGAKNDHSGFIVDP
jgi:hypothetical protein